MFYTRTINTIKYLYFNNEKIDTPAIFRELNSSRNGCDILGKWSCKKNKTSRKCEQFYVTLSYVTLELNNSGKIRLNAEYDKDLNGQTLII